MTDRRPRVLLVGAYERDNFGDLLFLLQTEQYLTDVDITEAAPFAGDMTALLDRKIPAFGHLLEREEYDHVWTVGGEVGATTFLGALLMSLGAKVMKSVRDVPEEQAREVLREICGEIPIESPYMPQLSTYPRNESASSVLHSIGLAGVPKQPAARQETLFQIFREAAAITVRDEASSAILRRHDIKHTLAPDLVHTLARTRPRPRPAEPTDILFQISDAHLRKRGYEPYAEAIARSPHLKGEKIRMFLAGTAAGHDSVESYEKIIDLVHQIDPSVDMGIVEARRPYDLVDVISQAKLWAGLSLHGRIVSAAYGVPRLSFGKAKLDAYARTWDPDMPYAIGADTLDAAVGEALSPAVQAKSAGLGEDLGAQADARIREVIAEIIGQPPAVRLANRLHGLEAHRRAQLKARDAQVAERDKKIATLESRVASALKEAGVSAKQLERLRSSRVYKATQALRRLRK